MEAYLDHAATTPMRPEAVDVMHRVLSGPCGNPSGVHDRSRRQRRLLDDARDELADVLGCEAGDVVFTAGGTEADNLAVFGVHERLGGSLLCSAVEHPAVLRPVLDRGGRRVAVDRRGRLDLTALEAVLDGSVTLVSIMAVNNEVGVIQPLAEMVERVRRLAPDAVIHCDAVQAVPWLAVAELLADVDLFSISGHKFGGPPGVGALIVRPGTPLAPQLLGGGQERDRRSGTQNVAGAVAMAAAARAAHDERAAVVTRVGALRDRLVAELTGRIDGCVETGVDGDDDGEHRIAGCAHVCFEGTESEALLFLLEQAGVAASAASSCASGALEPSPVLTAMAVPPGLAHGSLRLSLGWSTTAAEVDHALEVILAAVAQLRRRTPVPA